MGRGNNKRSISSVDEEIAQRITVLERLIQLEQARGMALRRRVADSIRPYTDAYLSMLEGSTSSSSQQGNTQVPDIVSTSSAGLARYGLTPPPSSRVAEEIAACTTQNLNDEENNNALGNGPTG